MTTPERAKEKRYYRIPPDGSTLWTWLECLAGGITAAVVFLLSLPALADLTRSLDLLSTTVIVFVFLFLWLSLWAVIGAIHERVWTA